MKKIFLSIIVFTLLTISVSSKNKLAEFGSYLGTLELNRPESITTAKTEFFKGFSLKDKETIRQAAFVSYYNFYMSVIAEINKEIEAAIEQTGYNYKSDKTDGIRMLSSEGMSWPDADYKFLIGTFQNYMSPAWLGYLKICDSNQEIFKDEALIISWDDLRLRIINMEKFVKTYPDFEKTGELNELLMLNFDVYLRGINNSPISEDFLFGENTTSPLRHDVKASYERFLQENKDSQYYPQVQSAYETLKKHGFIVGNWYFQ